MHARSRIGDEHRSGEIALRTAQNLGLRRIAGGSGRELHGRVAPDAVHVVFVREIRSGDPTSRELYRATLDGSSGELRLTANGSADDGPCWSPDGSTVLYSATTGGDRRLWKVGANGQGAREFLAADPGTIDRDPDWHWGTDRIAFHRRSEGRGRLWLVNGDGTGLTSLTAGVIGSASTGDFQPAFAPDGASVLFVRADTTGRSRLLRADVATGDVQELLDPGGGVALPRWSPRGDRIFCAISQPALGRPGLRLSRLLPDGSDPLLLLPDERWQSDGIEVLPAMLPEPRRGTPAVLDPDAANVQVAAGFVVAGGRRQLRAADGQSLALATETFQGNEIAGINARFDLPIPDSMAMAALRVRAVAALTRVDADPVLRLTLHNPVENRFDTITELVPASTGFLTLDFGTMSLAHVSLQRQIRVGVVGEIGPGARAELHIDLLEVTVIPTVLPP
jgi:dipeptidyl aminopeptidase/acylaminoacyl peptidase